ncbi:hypothetical protein [Streptacidiphilus sp. MAP5-3]|uniref:hypothetical protein n=1 Tax=unclassified Streptacidiphilus TaxID=2643834 RepID=UPI003514DD26
MNTVQTSVSSSNSSVSSSTTAEAFRPVKRLVGGYAALSAGTLVVAYLMRNHADLVTPTVWIRGGIVAFTSLLMLALAAGAARGRRGAYRRLRIASGVMLAVIAVMASLPGVLPVWMRFEQGVCGVLLVGVVAIANSRRTRALFAVDGPVAR